MLPPCRTAPCINHCNSDTKTGTYRLPAYHAEAVNSKIAVPVVLTLYRQFSPLKKGCMICRRETETRIAGNTRFFARLQ